MNVSILWGDERQRPAQIGDLIVDCVAGVETPGRDEPDDRDRRVERHVYDEPGRYAIVAVATGAGCGYSRTATVRDTFTVGAGTP